MAAQILTENDVQKNINKNRGISGCTLENLTAGT